MRRSTVKRPSSVTFLVAFVGDIRPARRGHNPFVLLNYSPTICLNTLPDRFREGVLAEFAG
jgi:hypothetical protein